MNLILLIGAMLGFSSLVIAAYVDHALTIYLSSQVLTEILTAVRYHQLYAVIISVLAVTLEMQMNLQFKSWLKKSAYVFSIGVLLFSGGIYLSVIFNMKNIIFVVPIGGMVLMLGWCFLLRAAFVKTRTT